MIEYEKYYYKMVWSPSSMTIETPNRGADHCNERRRQS